MVDLKKIWHFIWEEDSIWSWIVNVILAFILIKFMIFPLLGLILGSVVPVVAVVSSSMEHPGTFDEFWEKPAVCAEGLCLQREYYAEREISKEDFQKFKFKNGFNKGDVMVLTSAKNAEIGDTIVFIAANGRPIIHRIIGLDPLQTKGDNNAAQLTTNQINEVGINQESILGKASLRIPYIGYVKIAFASFLSLFGVQIS